MARTPAFERASVVRAARDVFWREGFESANVPDLERATGLNRSSLYNAFGSKRGLFDAAVQSYLIEVIRPRLAPLQAEPVAADALLSYLDGLRAAFLRVGSAAAPLGCLLINAAGAPIARDPDVARIIADYRRELRDAVARGVSARRPDTDTGTGTGTGEQHRIAETVTGLIIAAFAIVRVDPEQAVALLDAARGSIE